MKLKRVIYTIIFCSLFLLPLVTNDFEIPKILDKVKLSQDAPYLTGVFDDYGVDTDSNGKYDYLAIDVQVQVTVVGEYTVYIEYLNGSGASINVWNETVVNLLTIGMEYITVYLNGETIYDRGADGPYTVNYVELFFDNGTHTADDYLEYPYTTGVYSYTDFDSPGSTTDDPYLTGMFAEYGIDTNGNGKYEFLAIDVEFNATLTGTYDVYAGDLIGENSTYIYTSNTTEFEVLIPGIYTVAVYLDGREIYASGANGPYTVWTASIQLGTKYDSEFIPIVTRYYDYTDFEPSEGIVHSTLTGTFSDSGLDTNANGKYEYLAIDVGVNITIAGIYEVQIVGLIGADDELFYASSSVEESLQIGIHDVTIKLEGTDIYKSEKNGPYTLLYVSLSSESMSYYLSKPYTTSYYSYNDFEAPIVYPYPTEVFSDYGLDTDADGSFDFLVIQVEINMTIAMDIAVTINDLFADGSWISISGINDVGYLTEGLYNISVQLPTEAIYLSQKDGPYRLWSVAVQTDLHAEVRYPSYLTSSYLFTDFDAVLRMSYVRPSGGEILSTTEVVFSWTTNLESTTEVYLRPSGGSYTQYTGADAFEHIITIDELTLGVEYEFYVSSYSTSENLTVDSTTRTFIIGSGIGFDSSSYSATIDRDYNQEVMISVTNFDSYAHQLLVVVDSSYDDLYIGFIGNGSSDRPIYVNPLASLSVSLKAHAQDAMRLTYTIGLKLINLAATPDDEELIDYSVLTLILRPVEANFTLVEIADDPHTLTKTFNLTNYGSIITDITIYADSNLSSHLIWEPRITHIRMETFESKIIKARYIPDWSFTNNTSGIIYASGYTLIIDLNVVFQTDYELFFGGGDALYSEFIDTQFCVNNPFVQEEFGLIPGILPGEGLFGEVFAVIGEVTIGGETAAIGKRIYSNTLIDTGPYGSVTIFTSDGSMLIFGPNTRVGIRDPPGVGETVLDFIKGAGEFILSGVDAIFGTVGPDVYCNGWIGRRGTHFKLSYDDSTNEFEILLYHGALERYDNRTDTWQGFATDAEFGRTYNIVRQYNQGTGDYDLLFRNSTDFGEIWSGNQTLLSSPNLENVSITVGPNNAIFVAYELLDAIYYIMSQNNGTSWSVPELAVASGATNPYVCRVKDTNIVRLGWITNQGAYYEETINLGLSWSPVKRDPSYSKNAIEAYVEVKFRPTWGVRPHDVSILINGHEIAFLNNTIPHGTYLIPVNLEYLHFSYNGEIIPNVITLDTRHLPGGAYQVASHIRIIVRLSNMVIPVFCDSQAEADILSKNVTNVAFNVTDAGIYANHIESPDVVRTGMELEISAEVMNLGDNPISDVIVRFFVWTPPTHQWWPRDRISYDSLEWYQIGTNMSLPTIDSGCSASISIYWTPSERNDYQIYIEIISPSDEYEPNNFDYRMIFVRGDVDAPDIIVTYPNGGEIISGTVYISWIAEDPNPTDTLSFSVFYGNGIYWIPLDYNVPSLYLIWDSTTVSDGPYKIMINVTDGLFTASDISDDFFMIDNLMSTTATIPSTFTTPTTTTTHTPWYNEEFLGLKVWMWVAIGSGGIILVIVAIVIRKRRGSS